MRYRLRVQPILHLSRIQRLHRGTLEDGPASTLSEFLDGEGTANNHKSRRPLSRPLLPLRAHLVLLSECRRTDQ